MFYKSSNVSAEVFSVNQVKTEMKVSPTCRLIDLGKDMSVVCSACGTAAPATPPGYFSLIETHRTHTQTMGTDFSSKKHSDQNSFKIYMNIYLNVLVQNTGG